LKDRQKGFNQVATDSSVAMMMSEEKVNNGGIKTLPTVILQLIQKIISA
jgi:hypothetical protein